MKIAGPLLLGAFLLSSCGIVRDGIKRSAEIQEVEAAAGRLLGDRTVDAYLENSTDHMKIDIKNSPLRDLPSAERRAKALEVARLAYATYASRSSLKEIEVVFVVDKTETSTLTSTRTLDALVRYEFPVGDLQR